MPRLSPGEEALAYQLNLAGLPDPIREFRFAPPRRWRADFAWPDLMLIVEVEGGTWTRGRHSTGTGTEADCEKYATALCLGWRVLRVTTGQVTSGQALDWVRRLMAQTQQRPGQQPQGAPPNPRQPPPNPLMPPAAACTAATPAAAPRSRSRPPPPAP